MRRTPVYIVCSPRPQVGKTLLARVLTEFLLFQHGDVLAFDVSLREPSLVDFLPRQTETADVSDTFGKMALMDRLIANDGVPKVVDLGYHAFDEFFRMCDEIGFTKEAVRRGVDPVILYVPDAHRASVQGFRMLREKFPDIVLLVIDNEYVMRGEMPPALAAAPSLHLSALPAFLRTYFERLSFSFTAYVRDRNNTPTELFQWIWRSYVSFRDLGLNLSRYHR